MTSVLTLVLSIPAILMAVASLVVLRRLPMPTAPASVSRARTSAPADFDIPIRAA